MPPSSLLTLRLYRAACLCALLLLTYVVAQAPLWNPRLAGARVQLDTASLALGPSAWDCTDFPQTCTSMLLDSPLRVDIRWPADSPVACTASYDGQPVPCRPVLWYAPRLKPFLELGPVPNVRFQAAQRERPWHWLDAGLQGECGPVHFWAGVATAFLSALGLAAWLKGRGWRMATRVALAAGLFVLAYPAWFLARFCLGYVD